jgi:hypothetical protein
MDAVQYEVRIAGTAVYRDRRGEAFTSRRAMTCSECGARTGLTLSAHGEDTTITCPAGHTTQDWRLTPMAVRDVAAAARRRGTGQCRGLGQSPHRDRHPLTVDSFLEFLIAEVPFAGVTA